MKTALENFMDDMAEISKANEREWNKWRGTRYNVRIIRNQLEIVRRAVSHKRDTSQGDDVYLFARMEFIIKQAIRFIDELEANKVLNVIENLSIGASLKYVDDKIVAFNREYYDTHKSEQIKRKDIEII